jgi:hypothetical protein
MRRIAREQIGVTIRSSIKMALGNLTLGKLTLGNLAPGVLARSTLALGILALGCFGAILAASPSFGGEQSLLYPPEVRARPVVVVSGGGLQRRYWDPRYAALCPETPALHRWRDRSHP